MTVQTIISFLGRQSQIFVAKMYVCIYVFMYVCIQRADNDLILLSQSKYKNLYLLQGVDDRCGSGSSPVGPAEQVNGSKNSPRYVLNEAFEQALVLLRADVVFLCLQSGLPAAMLWPSEAILLNLHLLQRHMQRALLPVEG
jgi:hypothetical protein